MLQDEKILHKVENIVNNLFSQKIESWCFLWEWYISKVYKVCLHNGKQLVLKFLKQWQIWWFEYPLESVKSLIISDLMMKNAQDVNWVKSWGVFEVDWIYFQIMDFIEGKKMFLDDFMDEKIVKKVAEKIAFIHQHWKKIVDKFSEDFKQKLWKRWFREVFSNNETLFSIYEIYYLNWNAYALWWKIFNLILEKYKKFIQTNRYERLTILHWDFWYDNVIIWKDDVCFIDFSRIPYGDPGIDVGRFIWEPVVRYVLTGDLKRLNIVEKFLKKYIEITKDEEILKYIDLTILWVFYVDCSPLVQQFLKWNNQDIKNIESFIQDFDVNLKKVLK